MRWSRVLGVLQVVGLGLGIILAVVGSVSAFGMILTIDDALTGLGPYANIGPATPEVAKFLWADLWGSMAAMVVGIVLIAKCDL
jgi:hypothetical protein